MPLYDYNCQSCTKDFEAFQFINDRHSQTCPDCGVLAELQITYGSRVRTFSPYWDDNIDSEPVYFESKRQKKEYMKAKGVRLFEKGEKYRKVPERKKFSDVEVTYGKTVKASLDDADFVNL